MLMSVRVRLALTARASDRSPSVPMLLLLTDRLTEEGGGGEKHAWEGVLGGWDSRSQTAARRRQRLAHVHGPLALNAVEGEVDHVQGGVPLQHAGQMEGAVAAQAVAAEVQHKRQ